MSQIKQQTECNPEDPNRCTGVTITGNQCKYLSVSGEKFCQIHAYGLANRKTGPTMYDIANDEFKKRFERNKAIAPKTSREEEGILTVMLEQILESALGEDDNLSARSGEIVHLITTISKLKKDNFLIEKEMGQLITTDQLMVFGQVLLEIVTDEIQVFNKKYEKIHNKSAEDIYPVLENLMERFGGVEIE